ncbi:MAG: toprim domain-containing protein, partial [Patescibacteria group bacterium]|nr:toprim domain-containing protein [Patescibacteria group bacterium]
MLPKSVQNLIEEFSKLPGVGPRTAQRLAFYLLSKPDYDIKKLAEAVAKLKENLLSCKTCYNISEENPCLICQDSQRAKKIICVVEEPLDVQAMEKAGFKGKYHVLGGAISPIDDIGPED